MIKPFFLAIAAILALPPICVFSQPTDKAKSGFANTITFPIPQGDVKVHFGEKTVYLIDYDEEDGADPSYWFGSLFYAEFMGIKAKDNKTVSINNKSYPVRFWSSDSKVIAFDKANVNNLGGVFGILKAGKSNIVVAVQDKKVYIPMEVVKLHIRAGMLPAALIKAIGTPDTRIAAPSEGKRIHTINGKSVEVTPQNWTYKKYPGLRLIVDPIAGLDGWRMEGWDKIEQKYFLS